MTACEHNIFDIWFCRVVVLGAMTRKVSNHLGCTCTCGWSQRTVDASLTSKSTSGSITVKDCVLTRFAGDTRDARTSSNNE